MKVRWLALSLSLSLGACSGEPDSSPVVGLDVAGACADQEVCLSAGAKAATVEGVRVLHRRIGGAPTVAIRVVFELGNRGAEQYWAETLALALLSLNGPRSYENGDWRGALAALGASFQVSPYGSDSASVAVNVPAPLWKEAASLLTEAVRDPSDASLAWQVGSIENSYLTELDDPDAAASIHSWSLLFEGHRYDRDHASLAALDSIDESLVARAWAGLRTRHRMRLVVVGDVSWDDAAGVASVLARAVHEGEPEFEPAPADEAPPERDTASVYDYPDAPAWHVVARFRGPALDAASYPALAAGLAVLDERLWIEVRERRGLAYTVGASAGMSAESLGTLWFSTSDAAQTIPVVHDTLAGLLADGPSADELAAAVESLRSRTLSGATTAAGIAGWLGAWDVWTGQVADADAYLTALAALTPRQAHEALQMYLRNFQIVAAGAGQPLDEAALLQALPGHEARVE
jgi:predicted Zn-dependent peptidase